MFLGVLYAIICISYQGDVMGCYLSQRKRGGDPNSILFYAVEDKWNSETKKQDRKQTYLGSKLGDKYHFNEKAEQYSNLFLQSEHRRAFLKWQQLAKAEAEDSPLVSLDEVAACELKNAGLDLVLSHTADEIGLTEKLRSVFGGDLSEKLLSLAFYCAAEGRSPLYHASIWSRDQKLPGANEFTETAISRLLTETRVDEVQTFLAEWLKTSTPDERLSLDITSVSSYGANNEDVMHGYNRDKENLPQINLLMVVSQKTKLPLWYEQLPGAISDSTTVIDTIKTFVQAGTASRQLVLDRGFASFSNISYLLKNRFKFTMGIPLENFTNYREYLREAYKENKFCDPTNTLTMFDDYETAQTQACTKLMKIDGHRVYFHMYYTDYYRTRDNEIFMNRLNEVERKLKEGIKITSPKEQELAENCFVVKTTPKRGRRVTPLLDKIASFRENDSGFFAIMSNQFKSPQEALIVYKLRDGIEKRFDDLKTEADLKRLRMHSWHNQQIRLFIQFLAEILRCRLLYRMQTDEKFPKKIKTVSDLLWKMKSLRWVKIENHRGFYKRPTKTQRLIMDALNIGLTPNQCPSL